jgi:hypothetical protein
VNVAAASRERLWWTRAPLVLWRPVPVFEELRDDSAQESQARQEPVLAVVVLAGIAGVLSTTFAGTLLDEQNLDALDIALWAFLGGGLEGFALYFVFGAVVYVGGVAAGSTWRYRHARHLLAYAAVPLAASLVVWPVRLALYGMDSFRGGEEASFEAVETAFLGWSSALLVVGLRVLHAWTWGRTLAAAVLPLLVPGLAVLRAYGIV